MIINPFTPGFNRIPSVLIERADVQYMVNIQLRYAGQTSFQQPIMLVGPRGMGKTVLLEAIRNHAIESGWYGISLAHNGKDSLIEQLYRGLHGVQGLHGSQGLPESKPDGNSQKKMDIELGAHIGIISAKLHKTLESRDSLPIAELLLEATQYQPIIITVDEFQEFTNDQRWEFASLLSHITNENPALMVVCAALPKIHEASIRDFRRVTFFERAHWIDLSVFSPLDALDLVYRTSQGVFTIEQSEFIATQAGGYPYALQLFGFHIWETQQEKGKLSEIELYTGLEIGKKIFYQSIFQSRWMHEASNQVRAYLSAVAHTMNNSHKDSVTSAEVAKFLQSSPPQLSRYRDQLIKNGTLIQDGTKMRFLIPVMQTWTLEKDI